MMKTLSMALSDSLMKLVRSSFTGRMLSVKYSKRS